MLAPVGGDSKGGSTGPVRVPSKGRVRGSSKALQYRAPVRDDNLKQYLRTT